MASTYTVRVSLAAARGERRPVPRSVLLAELPAFAARIRAAGADVSLRVQARHGRPVVRLDARSAYDLRPATVALVAAIVARGWRIASAELGAAAERALDPTTLANLRGDGISR